MSSVNVEQEVEMGSLTLLARPPAASCILTLLCLLSIMEDAEERSQAVTVQGQFLCRVSELVSPVEMNNPVLAALFATPASRCDGLTQNMHQNCMLINPMY